MSNNCFSNWKCLCAKEALIRQQHASTKKAIIDDACVADTLRTSKLALYIKPDAEPLVQNFLTDEQIMLYLVTEKIK